MTFQDRAMALLRQHPAGLKTETMAGSLGRGLSDTYERLRLMRERGLIAFTVPRSSRGVWCMPVDAPRLRAIDAVAKREARLERMRVIARNKAAAARAEELDERPFIRRTVPALGAPPLVVRAPASVFDLARL
jgi:hypothetical protein